MEMNFKYLIKSRVPQMANTFHHIDRYDISRHFVDFSVYPLNIFCSRMRRWQHSRPWSCTISAAGRSSKEIVISSVFFM